MTSTTTQDVGENAVEDVGVERKEDGHTFAKVRNLKLCHIQIIEIHIYTNTALM